MEPTTLLFVEVFGMIALAAFLTVGSRELDHQRAPAGPVASISRWLRSHDGYRERDPRPFSGTTVHPKSSAGVSSPVQHPGES